MISGKCEEVNHLAYEKSPYLLQHRENPVNWYPWGEEAFGKAKQEDKPVFLSIGYSTCHWCHVMAHESFEDKEVAELLNTDFIAVKVDREERPDVDSVYMAVCQLLTGSGGWPLTVILSSDQKPFFAGTYFPKHSRYGHPGLIEILKEVSAQWKTNREELYCVGNQLAEVLSRKDDKASGIPDTILLEKAAEFFRSDYDSRFGGFGDAPKFPVPHNLFFLLCYARECKDIRAQKMVEHTLHAMADGGIFDHIGGGFSRYATDEKWLVPHFEKMLYDNALLAVAYLEAYQITKEEFYREIAVRTLDYILRELTGASGEFYCGQDADSEGIEGKYYLFTPDEIKAVLGKEGALFCRVYNITSKGNFCGRSIPNRIGSTLPVTKEIESGREKLFIYRRKRTVLPLDDKVILSWNAWAIVAMAKAANVLGEEKYLMAAKKSQSFIQRNMTDKAGRLFARWRDGEAAYAGYLDDYAVYGLALLEMYQVTFETGYLKQALFHAEQMIRLFEDKEEGGYYLTAYDAEQLIARRKETYDGAIPSGNAAAALLLSKLALAAGDIVLRDATDRQISFLAGAMGTMPYGHSFGLLALQKELYPSRKLICVSAEEKVPEELRKYLRENYDFHLSVLFKTKKNAEELSALLPYMESYPVPADGCLYYLCENGSCAAPKTAFKELNLQQNNSLADEFTESL